LSSINCYLRGVAASYGSISQTNEDLAFINPTWSPGQIFSKTGIRSRCIAAQGETALDLGQKASRLVLEQTCCDVKSIDCLIFVSQSADFILPSSACVLQHRLELSPSVAALDVGLGCSGYNYALWLGRSLIISRQARKVLIVCADTYSRYCGINDLATVTLFGDGAGATILQASDEDCLAVVGESILGTDGSGWEDLIVRDGGGRARSTGLPNVGSPVRLTMNGPNVFRFALDRAKPACNQLLHKISLNWDDIDMVFCHQANAFMLGTLQRQFGLDHSRMPIDITEIGNLSTASLPVHIARWVASDVRKPITDSIALGFGVGLSWGATHIRWIIN
jgi:3-oxoacyl-[acyl-carrier-protein] synthase-3